MRLAIVGSGISGLVCAHLLDPVHELTLFEADDRLGGHVHTVTCRAGDRSQEVDTGFSVYDERTDAGFTRLLARLDVASQPTSLSLAVRCDETGLEYNGRSLRGVFAQPRNLVRRAFWGLLRDIRRFGREAPGAIEDGAADWTVGELIERGGYSAAFVEQYLLPIGSALWSAPPEGFAAFPLRFVVRFLDDHAMLGWGGRPVWRVISGGSARYVEALTGRLRAEVRTRCPVTSVRRDADGVTLALAGIRRERFDEVLLACHSDQALRMLADPSELETEVLGALPFRDDHVLLHTDARAVLPRHPRARAAWNVQRRPGRRPRTSSDMNRLQGLDEPAATFCVTLGESDGIARDRVIRRLTYAHPQYTLASEAARGRQAELIRHRRTSYAGAYWGSGFHEDGVQSALAVCRAFGQELT